MARFFLQYHFQTLAVMANKKQLKSRQLPAWKFNLSDGSMRLRDLIKNVDGINMYNGLDMIIEVNADSEEEAVTLSKNHCETVLNLITLCTVTFCHPGRLINTIRFGQKNLPTLRYYVYPFDQKENYGSPVLIDESTFAKIHEAYYGQRDIESQRRLMRALTWLRKGINEEDTVDEFTSYWIGLEVLRCRLRRWLKKSGSKKDPGEWDGLKHVFEKELNYPDFENIKCARNGLLHGFRELSPDFVNEINGYVEPARRALIASAALVLGLEPKILRSIVSKDVRRALRQWHVIEGDIEGLPDDFDGLVSIYPRVELERSDQKSYEYDDEEGKLKVKGGYNLRMDMPNATWYPKAAEQWGGKDAGVDQGALSVEKNEQQ